MMFPIIIEKLPRKKPPSMALQYALLLVTSTRHAGIYHNIMTWYLTEYAGITDLMIIRFQK